MIENKDLRYYRLYQFDMKMLELDTKYNVLSSQYQYVRTTHREDQILVYERGDLLFVFNWNPTKSY